MNHTQACAAILAAYDEASPIDPASLDSVRTLADGEAVQARVVAARLARGERPVGFKIGFTNRTIWPLYGVHHPIWGPVWDTTLTMLDTPVACVPLARYVEPRLEPEIVLGLGTSPGSSTPEELFRCIDWIAHGVEIVQSPFPGWKFSAAQAVAAQSLHGALLVGPRRRRQPQDHYQDLAGLSLELSLDGRRVARGTGDLVLGGPLLALGHLIDELARRGDRLQGGSVITTGTLTDAQPMRPGQRWRTTITGFDLPGLDVETC